MFDRIARNDRFIRQVDQMLADLHTVAEVHEERVPWRSQARPEQLAPGSPGAAKSREDWNYWLILSGRSWGKALALDTPVPTSTGWSTMGALKVGDSIFGDDGNVCKVTFATEIQYGHVCYELEFDDGTKIVADAEHLWETWDKSARKSLGSGRKGAAPGIRTTQEVYESVQTGSKRPESNHSVHNCAPIQLPEAELPVHPYVLGVWLGNGDSKSSSISSSRQDYLEIQSHLRDCGEDSSSLSFDPRSQSCAFSLGAQDPQRDPETGRMVPNGSLHSRLRELGMIKGKKPRDGERGYWLRRKSIPAEYLRGSVAQRLDLLQGLMDTDGYASSKYGNCEFSSMSRYLAYGVLELVGSLGIKATLGTGRARYKGKDCGEKYRVKFTTHLPVFRLARKLSAQRKPKTIRTLHRYIRSVKPVDSVPVRCIQVDSPRSMFLVSKSFIPTHNTRTGAEWVIEQAKTRPRTHGALVGATADDVRKVMLSSGLESSEGASGILAISPPDFKPVYTPSQRLLTWPNGSTAGLYSAEEPNRLRGPQHHWAWVDEVAAWTKDQEALQQLLFTSRLRGRIQICLTTTPRPIQILRDLIANPATVVTHGTSYDNRANLSEDWFSRVIAPFEGTRIGRQELMGEMLDDNPGALWNLALVERSRVSRAPNLHRIVVAVDPSVADKDTALREDRSKTGKPTDETGIVVVGVGNCWCKNSEKPEIHAFVLADESVMAGPVEWSQKVSRVYADWKADRVIAEINNGGAMVEALLRSVNPNISYRGISASKNKRTRAEPVASLFEQGKVHMVGSHVRLEDQMTSWDPVRSQKSPDRLDAMVWGITELMLENQTTTGIQRQVSLSSYRSAIHPDDFGDRNFWNRPRR